MYGTTTDKNKPCCGLEKPKPRCPLKSALDRLLNNNLTGLALRTLPAFKLRTHGILAVGITSSLINVGTKTLMCFLF